MQSYQCPFCMAQFSEAEKAWHTAVNSGQCPRCRESLLNFPSPFSPNPQGHKPTAERLEPQAITTDVAASTSTAACSLSSRQPAIIRIAVVAIALFQTSFLLSVVFSVSESPRTASGQLAIDVTNIWSIAGGVAEAILIVGFAVALLKRHAWGAFGLLADAALNAIVKPLLFGAGAFFMSLVFVVIYWGGAKASLSSGDKRPQFYELRWHAIIRYGILVFIGWQGTGFMFGLLGLGKQMTMMPEYWIILSVWLIAVLALAAKNDTQWSFETVMCVSLIGSLLRLITDVPFYVLHQGMDLRSALIAWAFIHFVVMAFAVVAWGCTFVLPRPDLGVQPIRG